MKKKLLIFDADGTLWDSEKDTYLAFNHTLKENLGTEISKEEFKKFAGIDLDIMFEIVLPEEKRKFASEYSNKFRDYYINEKHYIDETKLFKNVKNTIDIFRKKGLFTAVASGKPEGILNTMINHFGLQGFDCVVGIARSNFIPKPDPGALNYIIDKLEVDKKDVVFIGDSKSDIICGKNAGIDTIAVTYGFDSKENLIGEKPTFIIDNFEELLNLIEECK